jgi:cyclophilin family peptidyl-prolyl cis-trans isomerase
LPDQPAGKPTGKPPTSSGTRRPSTGQRPSGTTKVTPSPPASNVGGIPWKPLLLIAGVIALAVIGTLFVLRPGSSGNGGTGGGDTVACPTKQPPALPAGETRTVTMATEKGTIVIKLEADLSPIATGNFAALVGCGFYDGVVFHRTAALDADTPFVIQGGDPTGTGSGGPGYTIQDEAVTAQYGRGVVAMARSSQPNSVGSQFFIVLSDEAKDALANYNTYQIIGNVTSGMDVADAIFAASSGVELPDDPVKMTTVTIANP